MKVEMKAFLVVASLFIVMALLIVACAGDDDDDDDNNDDSNETDDPCDGGCAVKVFNECTCAEDDPCGWIENGNCEEQQCLLVAYSSFDDSADCEIDGTCQPNCISGNCWGDSTQTCGSGGQTGDECGGNFECDCGFECDYNAEPYECTSRCEESCYNWDQPIAGAVEGEVCNTDMDCAPAFHCDA